ncbi:alpha/beta hydrolase [Streptomyces odontomachi]|uniref:alpha/beta hydrolase n=1 Tax=Streptomyces odontomachi TaxID=2944940 RepID=UPI002109E6A3|nr:alpha/beta hydrolase [Streptomyces sp. ODS25]
MNRRAVALCGIAAAVAGTVSAVPYSTTATAVAPASAPALRATAISTPTTGPRAAAAPGPAAQAAPGTTTLTWRKCPTDSYPTLQCASVRVPLDHDHPGGRQITLALSRVPHTAPASSFQGPLLVNPGGPGGSGLRLAGFVAAALPKDVAARYDVIGFDPRGVGKSTPALDCRAGHFAPVRPPSVPDGTAVEEANLTRARDFARACGAKYADVLPYLDTTSAARDMDVIRRALGAPKINYFGYSYGTYLGAVYGKLYPHRVRRMVLDSMVDPTGVWYTDNLAQDYAFNARQEAFFAWVAKNATTYRLGTDPAKVAAAWYAMRDAVRRAPAGGKVGAAELEDTFLPGGYYNGYWPDLAAAFAAYVVDRNPQPLVTAFSELGAVDAAGDNGYSVYTAVQCRDAAWPRDWQTWRDDNGRAHAKAPFSTWNNAWYNAPCAFWPVPAAGPVDIATDALPPVLLFQATDDAATPYEGGITVHGKLGASRLVVEQGGGNHGVTLSGNTCLDSHLTAYLASGKLPRARTGATVDAVCPRLPDPEPQSTKSTSARGAALHRMLGFRP